MCWKQGVPPLKFCPDLETETFCLQLRASEIFWDVRDTGQDRTGAVKAPGGTGNCNMGSFVRVDKGEHEGLRIKVKEEVGK
jgi:hypothetical protein